MEYQKEQLEEIKNNLTIEQVYDLVAELGGEPRMEGNYFVAQTLCHNHAGEGSHKLYYYNNTKLFKCYTNCGDTFDIFELICRHMNTIGQVKNYYTREGKLAERKWEVFDAIEFVLLYFHISSQNNNFFEEQEKLQDWSYFNILEKNSLVTLNKKTIEMRIFDENILKFLPRPHITPWEEEGITREVMMNRGIAYDPKNQGIVIPHYNEYGQLIGIRERTLIKEEEKYGKYRPAILSGQMYNHPLGFNLYNLNNSKDNISQMGKAIVWEGEKSSLLYASYFGEENDITVAACGSSLINYQVELLLKYGAKEIIVAFDKQFKQIGDDEWKKLTKNLKSIHNKYGAYAQISYLFDKKDLLGYKMSPIDAGPDVFLELFKERVII